MIETESIVAVAIVLIPLIAIWLLALYHIIARRSDLTIGWKAIWSAAVVLIPYVGVLIYAFVRPPAPVKGPRHNDTTATKRAIDELHHLVAEHDAGAMSDTEFATDKAAVFGMANT